jgi:hypothetical protein
MFYPIYLHIVPALGVLPLVVAKLFYELVKEVQRHILIVARDSAINFVCRTLRSGAGQHKQSARAEHPQHRLHSKNLESIVLQDLGAHDDVECVGVEFQLMGDTNTINAGTVAPIDA